jgi:hypothetical protein
MEQIEGTLLFPNVYNGLKNVITSKNNQSELLEDYVKHQWYKKHVSHGLSESHKSTQNTYYGYWSFEAGAVAKLLNLSDNTLRNGMM